MSASPGIPLVFDRPLQRQRLARALKRGFADFLLARVAEDMEARLDTTLRPFPRALDLGTPVPQIAAMLKVRLGERQVTRATALPEPADARWESVVADEETLPFAPCSFDLVVSGLALQWVNDLPGALIQIRRALAPDGLFMAAMAGGQTLQELRAAFAQAEDEISGGASPRVAPFSDLRDMGGLLQRAGFALPVTDTDCVTVRYPSLFALMADLRAMGATNVLVQRLKKPLRRDILLRAAELYARNHADADGRIRATFEIIWLSGWAPHESQQKPAPRGSGRVSLADALRPRGEPKADPEA